MTDAHTGHPEHLEVADAIDTLLREIDALVVRGLRTAGAAETAPLAAIHQELVRVGANHLAERVALVLDQVRGGGNGGPDALMKLVSTLRVFERVLTLDVAGRVLGAAVDELGESAAGGDA